MWSLDDATSCTIFTLNRHTPPNISSRYFQALIVRSFVRSFLHFPRYVYLLLRDSQKLIALDISPFDTNGMVHGCISKEYVHEYEFYALDFPDSRLLDMIEQSDICGFDANDHSTATPTTTKRVNVKMYKLCCSLIRYPPPYYLLTWTCLRIISSCIDFTNDDDNNMCMNKCALNMYTWKRSISVR